MAKDTSSEHQLTGKHVLLILLGFFGVMFAVNFYFVYVAVSSYPGEDVKNPYTQGIDFNDRLAQREAQEELGWKARIGIEGETGNRSLRVHIEDRNRIGISHLTVNAELRRTTSDREDRSLIFTPLGGGEYVYLLGDLSPGKWEVRLRAYKSGLEEPVFIANKSLVVE